MVANKYAKYVQPTPAPQPEQQPAPASQNKYRKYLQPAPEPAAPSANAANPIVTAQRQSQTQAMSQWAAQQEARKAAEAADAARRQQARREASRVNMGDFIVDENAAPIQTDYEKDIGKGMAGAPLSFGQGLAEGWANLANNVTNIGAENLNKANRLLLGDKAYQFTGTNIQVPRNVLIGEGAPLESVSGALPRGVGQMMAVRGPLGKVMPGGGLAGGALKDAVSFALTTPMGAPRLADMFPEGVPGIDLLRSKPDDSYTDAFTKNFVEDLTMSGASAGVMKAIEWAMGAGGSAGRQAARAPEPEPTPAPAPQAPAPTVQPFSAPAEPAGGGLMRGIGTRAVGGGIGATLGGVGDAIAAEGDGSRGGPDIINPITGAAAGVFGPQVVSRAWRAGVRPFRPPGFDERVASRAVRNALAPAGRTADEIAAAKVAQVGDKPATLADLTQQGQNLAVGLTRLPGQAGQLAVEQSDDVLRTRTGRLFSDVETTTKINPASVAGDLDEAIKQASEEISPAYEQLFAKYAGVNSERLMQLADDPVVSQYVRSAIKAAQSLATTAGQAPSNARIWDLVKRGLDRTIEGQKRSSGQAAYELEKARAAIKDELDALMPDYKAVRDAADAPRMKAARKEGAKIAGGNVLVERVREIASGLKGKPLTALQMGAVEKLALDIEKGRGIDGIASERMREILGAVFDDDTAAKLVARIRADQTIIKNAQRRNPNLGSATSQAAMGGAGGIQNAADLAQNALALKTNPLATVLAALSKSGAYTKAQRDLIAQMLLGGADPENLARIYGRRGGPTRGQPTPPAGPPVNPLTPPRRPPEQAGFGGSRKLPMDEASRMARAREQGFDVDRVAYRGLNRAYDEKGGGRRYQMFTSSQSDAAEYGSNVVEAYLRKGNNLQLDGGGRNFNSVSVSQLPDDVRAKLHPSIQGVARIDDIADAAQKAGYDSVTVANVFDNAWGEVPTKPRLRTQKDIDFDNELLRELGVDPADMPSAPRATTAPKKNTDPVTIDVVFDTKNIRSVNAKFDPSESSSSKLLAGIGANATGLGGAGGAVAGTVLAPDTNGDGVIDAQERGAGGMGGLVTGLVGGAGANRLLGPRRGGAPKAGPQKPPAQSGFGGGNISMRSYTQAAPEELDEWFNAEVEQVAKSGKTTTLRLKSSPETQVGTLRKLNDVHINFKNDGPGLAVDMTFRGGHSAAKYTANPKDVAAATRIFAKTLAAINVYVRKNTPAYITFYGATEAHTRLYKKLMERANINGYTPIVDRGSSSFMNKSAATGDVIGSTTPRVFERFMLIKDEELARFQRERPGAITAFSYPSVGTDGAPVIATAKNYAERTPIRR